MISASESFRAAFSVFHVVLPAQTGTARFDHSFGSSSSHDSVKSDEVALITTFVSAENVQPQHMRTADELLQSASLFVRSHCLTLP
jgi:hypothetical protein